jgi:hypothetical protein
MGRSWNPTSDKLDGCRLEDPDDSARIEIETAIERNIVVIPVLVDGATLPHRDQLPNSLKRLFGLANHWDCWDTFGYDVEKLTRALSPHVRGGIFAKASAVRALVGAAIAFGAVLGGYYYYAKEASGCIFKGKWDCLKCANNEAVAYESTVGGNNREVETRQNGIKINGVFDIEKNTIVFEEFPYNNHPQGDRNIHTGLQIDKLVAY